ncbi:MAG: exodeoxyribonuclease VII small subunit [Actinomycetia bacterium]|nr:exodeoxyribonuclease VII small subunit [Actinomycetes bacterium]
MGIEELSYRQATEQLEGVLRQLESNQLELEESLAAYERGVALLRMLRGRLNDAQQKVTVLMGEVDTDAGDDIDRLLS